MILKEGNTGHLRTGEYNESSFSTRSKVGNGSKRSGTNVDSVVNTGVGSNSWGTTEKKVVGRRSWFESTDPSDPEPSAVSVD